MNRTSKSIKSVEAAKCSTKAAPIKKKYQKHYMEANEFVAKTFRNDGTMQSIEVDNKVMVRTNESSDKTI